MLPADLDSILTHVNQDISFYERMREGEDYPVRSSFNGVLDRLRVLDSHLSRIRHQSKCKGCESIQHIGQNLNEKVENPIFFFCCLDCEVSRVFPENDVPTHYVIAHSTHSTAIIKMVG